MVCRHRPGDPDCSSSRGYVPPYVAPSNTPDPKDFNITDAVEVNGHLLLKVKYPLCLGLSLK